MAASEKLVEWRKEKGLTQREAAELAGVSQPTWHAYEAGTGIPRTNAALAIERATSGAVSVADWAESEERRAVRQARAASRRVRSRKPRAA